MIIRKVFFLLLLTLLVVYLYSQEESKGINPNKMSNFSEEDISGIDLNKQHALKMG